MKYIAFNILVILSLGYLCLVAPSMPMIGKVDGVTAVTPSTFPIIGMLGATRQRYPNDKITKILKAIYFMELLRVR